MALALTFHPNRLPVFPEKHQISKAELKFKVVLVVSGPRQETIANANPVWRNSSQGMPKNGHRLSCIKKQATHREKSHK